MPQNPYQPPKVGHSLVNTPGTPPRSMTWLLFSFQGRATRWDYWKGTILLFGLSLVLVLVVFIPLALMGSGSEADPAELGVAAFGLLSLPIYWAAFALNVKRWHDRNKSGFWMLVALVPVIGTLWTFIECGCLPGTLGDNQYGAEPNS